jgi:Ca2+-transporting ATPase
MIIILVVAAVISAFVGHPSDAAIILSVVIVNALLGVIQEARAEKALDALKKMSAPFVRVQRAGQVLRVKTEELVPGDLVLLEAGDVVPADLRLVETASLKIEEAPLTGESVPVEKDAEVVVKPDAVLGDRINMAYSGCSVTYGRGMGVVTAIGMDTEVGKIATHLSEEVETATPLQIKLAELGKVLTIGVLAVAVVVFIVGAQRA